LLAPLLFGTGRCLALPQPEAIRAFTCTIRKQISRQITEDHPIPFTNCQKSDRENDQELMYLSFILLQHATLTGFISIAENLTGFFTS
jgi:hypothetical protein